MTKAETRRACKGASNQIARLDADTQKAFIGLTGPELKEEETMGCPFTQIGSPIAALRRPSACGTGRRHRLRETGPE